MTVSHSAGERAGSIEERLRKLEKINRALMGRVERSTDFSGNGFSLFQTAILLEGQVHGGLAQGAGHVFGEHAVYDEESGQLLTGSFQD